MSSNQPTDPGGAPAEANASGQDNLALWARVERTDPTFTRPFTGGAYSGTAISPAWLVRRATEQFGPLGIGWGYEIVDERFVEGAPLGFDSRGETLGPSRVHILRLRLWYLWRGQKGSFEHFGQTPFIGRATEGRLATDSDVAKKSLTDALTKCLSMLGFGGDVHLGLYDDVKYVQGLDREYSAAYQAAAQRPGAAGSRPAATEGDTRARAKPRAGKPAGAAEGADAADAAEPAGTPSAADAAQGGSRASDASPAPAAPGGGVPPSLKAWLQRIATVGADGLDFTTEVVRRTFSGAELQELEEALAQRTAFLSNSSS